MVEWGEEGKEEERVVRREEKVGTEKVMTPKLGCIHRYCRIAN